MADEEEKVVEQPQEETPKEEEGAPAQEEEKPAQEGQDANNSDVDNAYHSADEGNTGQVVKKRVRRMRKKKGPTGWDLTNNNHLPTNKYNALKDAHLQSFFVNDRVRKHLRKMYLITKEGYIVEKPEEYRRNKNLLQMHYASQSPKKITKKGGMKGPRVDKTDHAQFIEDVKNQYGAQSNQEEAEEQPAEQNEGEQPKQEEEEVKEEV